MYIIICLALVLACSGNDSTSEEPEIPEEEVIYGSDNDNQGLLKDLKIMTYNIHAANPPSKSGVCDLAAIARVINGANPDIVMLQEVDKNTGRNDYFGNQAKELGELTKMNSLFFPAISYKNGYYGVAVLSRYPLYSSELHRLPKEKGEEQRVLGTAWADLPGEDSVLVACTHLQHNSTSYRFEQVTKIIQILSSTTAPVVIGGDFNEKPDRVEFFSVFDAAFTRTCVSNCGFTFSTANPIAIIDYMAFKPSHAFSINSHEVITDYYASDHLPLMASLRFIREAKN